MIVKKLLNLKAIYHFAGHHVIWLTLWMALVTGLYAFTHWKWMAIPWLPVSVIGTAVAFYVGFKNNQAYDRLWEGRKIWGSIINHSRIWGSMIRAYITSDTRDEAELLSIKRSLIYRHIAWLYTLREQLLVPTQWEHVSLGFRFGVFNQHRRDVIIGAYKQELDEIDVKRYIPIGEFNKNTGFSNVATHLIDKQTGELARLQTDGKLDILRQLELQKILNEFHENQGRAERIKKFPLPRQYGSFSFIFVCIFIFLLPFGIIGEFSKIGEHGLWLAVPFGVIVGWIYVVMELIGDYSENPFEGLHNDVPMLSICRTIEIDLLQMIGEQNIPKPIQPKSGVLM